MLSYKVLPNLKLIVTKTSGVVTLPMVEEAVIALEREQDSHGGGLNVLTMAEDLVVDISVDDFYMLASRLGKINRQTHMVACVGQDDYLYEMTRMWETVAETNAPQTIMSFRTVKEACAWLEVPEDQVLQALAEL